MDTLTFYLSPESVVIFLSKLSILSLLGKISKLVFKNMHPLLQGRQKLGKANNLAGITFSKIDSLSVKIGVERENCYKSQYVIKLAHLIQKYLSTHPNHISLQKNPTHLFKLLQRVRIKLPQIHSTAQRQQLCGSVYSYYFMGRCLI